MRIGIDASRAFKKNPTGVERYAYQLIRSLRSTDLRSKEVYLYMHRDQSPDFSLPPKWRIIRFNFPFAWTQIGLSIRLFRDNVDIFLAPASALSMFAPKKSIVVVHGLEYENFPQGYAWINRIMTRFLMRLSCRRAYRIIAVSQSTKRDIVRYHYAHTSKVSCIYEGFSLPERNAEYFDNIEYALAPIANKPFFLCIGRLEKRKNILGTIRAFELCKTRTSFPHKLVLVGAEGFGSGEIYEAIKSSEFARDIILTGYINDAERNFLLCASAALLFLSHAEGFGIPILEAQSLEVPVIASDISVFHEVAGLGAMFTRGNCNDIARKMEKVISDDELRNRVISLGRGNVQRFSWSTCAQQVGDVLLKEI